MAQGQDGSRNRGVLSFLLSACIRSCNNMGPVRNTFPEFGKGIAIEPLRWLLAWNIQRQFYNAVVLGLSRLTDEQRVAGKRTLSFKRLFHLCEGLDGLVLQDQIDELGNAVKSLRIARNQVLAHLDYDVAVNKVAGPSRSSRADVTSVFKILLRILDRILSHFESSGLTLMSLGNNSALSLLYYLHFGLRHVAEIKLSAKNGDWRRMKDANAPEWLRLTKNEQERYRIDWPHL